MKNITLTLFLLYAVVGFAQKDVTNVNLFIGIPDSIYKDEIRIYKDYSISNGKDLFRMYKDDKGNWNSEFYQYRGAAGGMKQSYLKTVLVAVHDPKFVWYSIGVCNIDNLPKWETFNYKLEKSIVIYMEGKYAINTTRAYLSDGVGYEVFTKANYINYDNPESYLKKFPGVDELESFSSMLKLVREEFGIWNER